MICNLIKNKTTQGIFPLPFLQVLYYRFLIQIFRNETAVPWS